MSSTELISQDCNQMHRVHSSNSAASDYSESGSQISSPLPDGIKSTKDIEIEMDSLTVFGELKTKHVSRSKVWRVKEDDEVIIEKIIGKGVLYLGTSITLLSFDSASCDDTLSCNNRCMHLKGGTSYNLSYRKYDSHDKLIIHYRKLFTLKM